MKNPILKTKQPKEITKRQTKNKHTRQILKKVNERNPIIKEKKRSENSSNLTNKLRKREKFLLVYHNIKKKITIKST